MNLTFDSFIQLIATNIFDGSTTLAALAIMIAAWAVCLVILMNAKAPPAYSVVPMIPIAIFFSAYGLLSTSVMVIIVLVSAALIATEFKKVVD